MGKHGLLIVICIVLSISGSLAAVSFIIPREPLSMDVADIDLDGNYDVAIGHEGVAVPNHTYPAITLLRNFQNNSFTSIDSPYAYPGYIGAIHFSDMNNDQFPELLILYGEYIGSTGYAYTRIFHNNAGFYLNPTDYLTTTDVSFFDFILSDVDGDGHKDPICISNSGHLWTSMFNLDNYTFSPTIINQLTYPPQSVTSGDLTGDGIDDILISGQPLTLFSYANDNWSETIVDPINFISDSVICDMDNDGENEIVTYQIPGAGNDCILRIYDKQNGQFIIVYQHIYSFVSSLAVFDYNNDDLPDILLFNKLITNMGNYAFSEPGILPFATAGNKNVFADMDHNGYLDILSFITDYPSYITRFYIYFNDGNGNFLADPIVANDDNHNEPIPQIKLSCYPNPFNPSTTICFSLPKEMKCSIDVFNIKGQKVKSLLKGTQIKGSHKIVWDGTDDSGRSVSSGMYFYKLTTPERVLTNKMIMLK